MPRVYLIKAYRIKSSAEVSIIASNKRQAIKKIREGKFRGKLKFEKSVISPIYLAFEKTTKWRERFIEK